LRVAQRRGERRVVDGRVLQVPDGFARRFVAGLLVGGVDLDRAGQYVDRGDGRGVHLAVTHRVLQEEAEERQGGVGAGVALRGRQEVVEQRTPLGRERWEHGVGRDGRR